MSSSRCATCKEKVPFSPAAPPQFEAPIHPVEFSELGDQIDGAHARLAAIQEQVAVLQAKVSKWDDLESRVDAGLAMVRDRERERADGDKAAPTGVIDDPIRRRLRVKDAIGQLTVKDASKPFVRGMIDADASLSRNGRRLLEERGFPFTDAQRRAFHRTLSGLAIPVARALDVIVNGFGTDIYESVAIHSQEPESRPTGDIEADHVHVLLNIVEQYGDPRITATQFCEAVVQATGSMKAFVFDEDD